MKYCSLIILIFFFVFFAFSSFAQDKVGKDKVVLVIHGGAGTISKSKMTAVKEIAYKNALEESLRVGANVLSKGGSGTDAIVESIKILENSPLFNAGKGAVFTHDGQNELDASIMDGETGKAGAVAGVKTIKNPITAAKEVMMHSDHVLLVGSGAEQFAQSRKVEIVDLSYFFTKERWDGLQRILQEGQRKIELDHDGPNKVSYDGKSDDKFGTVGCVALDKKGYLSAGTSTGGMTNKRFGRVGDSPIIGAGTYANDQVGVSCTGWGEFFIREVAAYDVAALMKYKNLSVEEAGKEVIRKIGGKGGDGGMIILDKEGNVAMPFNTAGMYRGYITESGKIFIEIYK